MPVTLKRDDERLTDTQKLLDQRAAENEITPFADPFAIGIGDMLDNEPPPRRWLVDNLLPLGVVGLLAAGGGTGKSFLTIQLAIAVATGRPFLGMNIGEPGGVLMIAAEDERDEMHRRLWRIVQWLRADGDISAADEDLLRERLFIVSSVGRDNRLTAEEDRAIFCTRTGDRIEALIDQLPPIQLIVLDPVSRFRGGDENANDAATRFVEAVETLRAATGATVLLPHHVSKQGLKAGAEALSVEGLRGASALVDGVRWAAAMATLRKDCAEDYGIDPEDAGFYVRLDAVKNNYAAPWPGIWLERQPGGVLAPVEMKIVQRQKKEQKDEDLYAQVLPKLQALIRQKQESGQPLIKSQLRDYAGKGGRLGIGDQLSRRILQRAIDDGYISESRRDRGPGMVLRTYVG